MQRRYFIKLLAGTGAVMMSGLDLLLRPLLAVTARNKPAFSAGKLDEAMLQLFNGEPITASDAIAIGVHDLVENGAVVPVKINSNLPDVDSISIFVEKNPNPLIAHFKLNPRCEAFVATRIKIQFPSDLMAVVRSGGKLYKTTKFVEVVEGGCG